VVSAVPLVALLHAAGWRTTFLSVAAVGVVATIAVLAVVRDAPGEVTPRRARPPRERGALRAVLREPAVRLAFWIHFSGQFSNHVVVLLWGFAFFVEGQGRTAAEASALLTLNVVAAVVAGPVIGLLAGRHPRARFAMAMGTSVAIGLAWLAVVLPSGPVPLGVLGTFVVVVGVGGPMSLVAFDVARSRVPAPRLGSATGFVNTGGFVGAFATMLVVGLVLDRATGGAALRDLDAFRSAFAWVAVPWAVGVAGMLLGRRAVRRDETPL
jgi:predicted MFS family arabinose efflux permease